MKPSIRSRSPQLGAGSAKDALEPLVDERSHLVDPLGELLRPRVEHAPAGLHVRGESVELAADVRLNLRESAFERHHQLGSSAIEDVGSLREALLESLLARVADVTEPLREDGLRVAREHRSRALELSREPLSRVLPRRLDRFRELLLGRLRVAGGGALDNALELLDLTPPDVLEARCNPADRFVLFALDLLAELALATAKAFSDLVERSATLSGMLVELGGRGRECLLGGLPELLAEPDDSRALLLGRGLDALGVLLDAGPHVGEQALLPFAKPSDLRFERMLCLLHVGRPFRETLLHLALGGRERLGKLGRSLLLPFRQQTIPVALELPLLLGDHRPDLRVATRQSALELLGPPVRVLRDQPGELRLSPAQLLLHGPSPHEEAGEEDHREPRSRTDREPCRRNRELPLGFEPEGRPRRRAGRSEEHTSELQSHHDLVCRLLLEKKKKTKNKNKKKKKKKIKKKKKRKKNNK